jgi:hypothetical protein
MWRFDSQRDDFGNFSLSAGKLDILPNNIEKRFS